MVIRNQEKKETWERRIIGLDMHPDVFTTAILSGSNATDALVHGIYDQLPQESLERWLKRHTTLDDLFVIEASGNTFATVDRIEAAERHVIVLESVRAAQIRKAYCNNDKSSAVKLARIYLSGLAHVVWKPNEETRAKREVLNCHRRAVQDTTRARNRIRSWLTGHGKRAQKGLRLAKQSGKIWVLSCREWSPLQERMIEHMFDDLWQAEERRKELRAIMAEEITKDPQMLKLIRLFGIRHITAYALAAVIGDINRFRTPKQLSAYIGLVSRVDQSGNKNKKNGRISRHGRKELRRLLIQAAKSIIRYDTGPLHKWAIRLSFRRGQNIATVAVARKIAVACWYLMQGRFTQMEEAPAIIHRKIRKLATAIGKAKIQDMGYKTMEEFKEEKIALLLNTT